MSHANLLENGKAALVVVDVQEAFRSAVPDFALVVSRIATAIRGFQVLGAPVIVTEQYPKGLGHTAEELQLILDDGSGALEKTAFSACGAVGFANLLEEEGITQVVLCGLETHICVNQTAHDLIDRGYQVHLLSDCVASRFDYNRLAGISKMRRAGVIETSTEMALFEMLRDASHEKFKEIQALIK